MASKPVPLTKVIAVNGPESDPGRGNAARYSSGRADKSSVLVLNRHRVVADMCRIRPNVIPAGLNGNQLTAYLEGYAAAAAWTFAGEAFENSSLGSHLQVSFFRGFNDRLAETAKSEQAS